MQATESHHALTPRRELVTLLALAAVQFTHVIDFMIIVPMGEQLMRAFAIAPAQFSRLVAVYGFAAALSGLAGGFVLDRVDRKRALLTLYAGFAVATLGCALAPTHHWLLVARTAAGAFGGLASSMVIAMIGDIVPPSRRGRAMSWVGAAFPVALVLGVPLGLVLAGRFGWHAPFYFVAALSAANLVIGAFALPHLRTAVLGHRPLRQMREILSHGTHLRAFAVTIGLAISGGVLIPFIAPSYVANVGLSEDRGLPLAYIVGGIATAVSTPIIGGLCDRIDRLRLLTIMSAMALVVTVVITHLGQVGLAVASATMALFMVAMSGRFTPALTMITNAVEARYRGGFMSVNSALQQATVGLANLLAGLFVTRDPSGRLVGLPTVGYVAVAFLFLTVLLAAQLRAAAPHVSAPAPRVADPVAGEASA